MAGGGAKVLHGVVPGACGGVKGLTGGGGAAKSGPFHREYARLRHHGVLCLVLLKVSSLRFSNNSEGKSDHFEIVR